MNEQDVKLKRQVRDWFNKNIHDMLSLSMVAQIIGYEPVKERCSDMESGIKYDECVEIAGVETRTWLVEFETGKKSLYVTGRGVKIEDVVNLVLKWDTGQHYFTVTTVTVGTFDIDTITTMYSNGRKLNSNKEVVVDIGCQKEGIA